MRKPPIITLSLPVPWSSKPASIRIHDTTVAAILVIAIAVLLFLFGMSLGGGGLEPTPNPSSVRRQVVRLYR
jgi:hypothetical protein